MASIVYNPSNAQPESVSVKTGAYTIPAGYYAYVTASVQNSDTFSIGGVVALQAIAFGSESGTGGAISSIDVETTSTTTASYTVPTGYKAEFYLFFSGGQTSFSNTHTFTIGSFSRALSDIVAATGFFDGLVRTGTATVFRAGTGEVISIATSGTGATATKNIFGYAERPNSIIPGVSGSTVSGSFWVAAGTALTTSGGSYTVTLYKNIV